MTCCDVRNVRYPAPQARIVRVAAPAAPSVVRQELRALQDRQALKVLLAPKEPQVAKDRPAPRDRKAPLAQ